ncbi:hypothetical protein ACFXG4_27545 [Nocardia sp. NPDC059246]|uniref:hypothetical protein n=1 Tax=unclassified Nocardia TaxID=2637762 RepID=UPI0036AFCF57
MHEPLLEQRGLDRGSADCRTRENRQGFVDHRDGGIDLSRNQFGDRVQTYIPHGETGEMSACRDMPSECDNLITGRTVFSYTHNRHADNSTGRFCRSSSSKIRIQLTLLPIRSTD